MYENMALLNEEEETELELCNENGHPDKTHKVSERATFEEAITRTGYGYFHYGLLLLCGWALSSDAIEVLSLSFILPPATCELSLSSHNKGWLTAIIFVGMMFGGYIWGCLADIYGRRYVLLWSLTVNGFGGLAASFAPNFTSFLILRFISGIGVGGSLPVVFAYFTEFQPKERRGSMISLLATFWMSGNIIAAALAWLIIPIAPLGHLLNLPYNSWRLYLAICTLPAISSGLVFSCMPESPKYLMEVGHKEEALRVFERMYRINSYRSNKSEFDVFDLQCHVKKLDLSTKSTGISSLCVKFIKTIKQFFVSIRELYKPPLTLVSVVMTIVYFTLSFGYYGLYMWFPELFNRMEKNGGSACSIDRVSILNNSIIENSNMDNKTCDATIASNIYFDTLLTALSNLPGNIFTIIVIDRLGRKTLLASSMVLSAVSVFFIATLHSKLESVIFSCIFGGISVIGWNALDVLSMELFPTELRSTATGLYMGIGRIGAILANIIFGVLVDVYCVIPMLLVGCFMSLGGLLSLLLPQTTHLDLN